jgi:glycosyltransferase involved in cell wall biosynthesis
MQNKIVIITSGHPPYDERIFWKFGLSLQNRNFFVTIICSTLCINEELKGITIKGFENKRMNKKEKILKFLKYLSDVSPQIIICCEPLTIIPALIYKIRRNRKCKIVYDVTEWYPENVTSKQHGIKKYLSYIVFFKLNAILSNLTSALIIGEITKKKRYDLIAPFKRKVIIGYYPVIEYFKYNPPKFDGANLVLCYAGLISFQRGIKRLVEIASAVANNYKNINIKLEIVGRFQSPVEEKEFDEFAKEYNNITIEKKGWTDYNNISNLIADADICFDLRERNFIYNNSLPIKIFEYMAAGKPYIFTDVEPIRKEFGSMDCGSLVAPDNMDEIIKKIELYISNPKLLIQHSEAARAFIENGKNWESESGKLIKLINSLLNPDLN